MGYMALALKGMPERPVLVSDAPVYFGNSGGPLVNERGHLVGVCSQIFKFGSDDGWAPTFGAFVPIEAILEFLGRDDEPSLVAP